MGAPGNDKAVSAIMKWVNREDWRADFDNLADQHLAPVCEEWDLEPNDLATELGEEAFTQVFGCILEDFLTSRLEPDGRNVVDDYLKRRGWKEAKPVKRYLEALRDSTMSLYEVIETIPGQGFVARDLLRESEPVQVEDKLASAHLVRWDRMAARLLPLGNKTYMSGGTLPISFLDAGAIGETIAELRKETKRDFRRLAKRVEVAVDLVNEMPIDEALFHNTAPLFIRAWVEGLLSDSLEPDMPTMANMDGEDLMPAEVRFPIANAAEIDEIAARLDAMGEFTRDHPDRQVWTWLGSKPEDDQPRGRSKKKRSGRREDERLWICGWVRLSDTALMLDTNSMERATRGGAMLAEHLGDLVRPSLTTTQSLEQALQETASDFLSAEAELPISPAESGDVIRQALEHYYRHILKSPVPMLDGKTPKQAVRSKSGRRMTAEWLRYLENQSAHRAANDTMPAYDFSWMWEELKLTELRG